MEKKKKRFRMYKALYAVFLAGFTVYVLLDTFVIKREYQKVQENENSFYEEFTKSSGEDAEEGSGEDTEENRGEDSQKTDAENDGESTGETTGDAVQIEVKTYRENDTTIYVADIQLSDIRYLRSAFAENTYGKNVTDTTSEIAKEHDALLAINGDFYGAQNSGYVIRNGVLYRSKKRSTAQEDLVIWTDGSFEIIKEEEITAEELLEQGALQVFSFGPALLDDGEIQVSETQEVGKAMESNPRTAIGMIDELHYVMVVADGRTSKSEGLSLYELAGFMQELEVKTAYNLDGGGSSTMYYEGEVVNQPTTNGKSIKERSVSDIVYIGQN